MRKSWTENADTALAGVAGPWVLLFADWILPGDMRMLGIRPRTLGGLWGILLCPFLHVNLIHLLANSLALFVLLALALALDRKLTGRAIVAIVLASGVFAWLFGRAGTVHIGASGVVFGLIGFLLMSGLIRFELRALALGVVVFVLYGGALLTLLRHVPGISWQLHVGGFAGGVVSAWRLRDEPMD